MDKGLCSTKISVLNGCHRIFLSLRNWPIYPQSHNFVFNSVGSLVSQLRADRSSLLAEWWWEKCFTSWDRHVPSHWNELLHLQSPPTQDYNLLKCSSMWYSLLISQSGTQVPSTLWFHHLLKCWCILIDSLCPTSKREGEGSPAEV